MAPRRILIVRLGAMGDIVHALPAVAALRRTFPDARIDWAIHPKWRDLLEANPLGVAPIFLDRRDLSVCRAAFARLRAAHYDVAVDLQGLLQSALVGRLARPSALYGYEPAQAREWPAALLYSNPVRTRAAHVVERCLELVEAAGARPSPQAVEFAGPERGTVESPLPPGRAEGVPVEAAGAQPRPRVAGVVGAGRGAVESPLPPGRAEGVQVEAAGAQPRARVAGVVGAGRCAVEFPLPPGRAEGVLPERFVLAAPLAGWRSKQWPLEFYAPLARRLREELGLELVLNGAPAAEPLLRQVEGAIVHLSGIAGLIWATRRATATLGLDSGPMHLAAALDRPGVALFGPTDPARNGPYGGSVTVLRDAQALTTYRRGTEIDPAMRRLTPAMVFEALAQCGGTPTA